MRRVPLIGVPSDRKQIGPHPFHAVGEKYLRAITDAGVGLPLILPAFGDAVLVDDLIENLDGLLLTGSPSNIEPHHYGDESSWEGNPHDPARDATTLPLLRRAVAVGLPVLAVCRGFQEVNVAFGGTLLQRVHESAGHADHREDTSQPLDVQYAPAHPIELTPDGWLAKIAGRNEVSVNSLHGQGIARLGAGLLVEARARDGLIEAIRLDSPEPFLLAVQWHPEWKVTENAFYLGIFKLFAAAVRKHADSRA